MTDIIPESLAKTFDPSAIEAKWYAHWESTGAFRPARPDAEPYTIVMPPPNVTGSLHIGHALDNTLQDILIRHARLCGKDALWVVGTDHAGIATQMVVERQMALHQQKRTDFARDEFVAKVWEWKAESGGTITRQLRRLGASCDWANERFTMDEGFSKAVTKVFVDLYNQGLLYRDKRLVNWDPGLKTAISDLEVETVEVNGKFWHFRYPLADGATTADGKDYIVVATTRPETMLADMAVAVNEKDERYRSLIEAKAEVILPITGRRIPIITDDHADPELGSGAVKITPGHDFNDFEVGKRAGFKAGEMLNMLDAEAKVVQTSDRLIPDALLGLSVADARKEVVALIDAAGLLERVEDRVIQTPYGDRSGVVIEPWLTDQWYVDAATLAGPAIEAVKSGAIKVVPQSWEKTYFNWMENIQPWCVSRQLWWGHRIPAWYGPVVEEFEGKRHFLYYNDYLFETQRNRARDERVFVGDTEEEVKELAREFYRSEKLSNPDIVFVASRQLASELGDGNTIALFRDSDVLDTWFSSALWPFGTLGWPDDVPSPPSGGEGRTAQPDGERGESASGQRPPAPSLAPLAFPSPPEGGEGGSLLARHYPGDVLISGFDILFFWDARMIMQGLHFMKEVPWKTLYLHGLVRAADGSKMSKSKGNTVDPLGLIDKYGADALRFTLTAMESQGRDIKLDEKRVEGYRNFATKLWNAARFAQANGIGASNSVAAPKAELAVNRWIIGEVVETLGRLNQAIADLRFDAMADTVYHFAWGTFCDWYLELIKPVLAPLPFRGGVGGGGCPPTPTPVSVDNPRPNPSPEGEGLEAAETRAVAAWVFDQILVMLHPFMPFITEELWGAMGAREYGLIHAKWPVQGAGVDAEAKAEVENIVRLLIEVRSIRTEYSLPWSAVLRLQLADDDVEYRRQLFGYASTIRRMAKIEIQQSQSGTTDQLTAEEFNEQYAQGGNIQFVVDGRTFILLVSEGVDLAAERARISNAITAITKERDALAARLNNPAFVEKAKPEAVAKARADHGEKSAEVERLGAALARLG